MKDKPVTAFSIQFKEFEDKVEAQMIMPNGSFYNAEVDIEKRGVEQLSETYFLENDTRISDAYERIMAMAIRTFLEETNRAHSCGIKLNAPFKDRIVIEKQELNTIFQDEVPKEITLSTFKKRHRYILKDVDI